MKKVIRPILLVIFLGAFGYTLYYLWDKSRKEPEIYDTEKPFITDITKKSVATGSIVPREEIDIKPQISGIIQEIYVEAGETVEVGDPLARIKVIPDMVALNNAQNRVERAEIALDNAKKDFDRNKKLFDKKVIAYAEFQQTETAYKNAQQELEAAQDNLEIVKEGASKKQAENALNVVSATISGMVLDVPVKVGNQVIESNNFNEGTSIATLADMTKLIFEGQIDESEVGKLNEGMDIVLTVGAIDDQKFDAKLEYISPKGVEENGAVQFEIKARVMLDSSDFIRAGYSANANIVLAQKDSVLAIKESLLQFDKQQPYVEVAVGEQKFERREVKTGLSDGINVEILEGVDKETPIKVWNQAR